LLTSGQITKPAKQYLRVQYEQLNPAELRRKLETLQEQLEQASHTKGDVVHRPAAHGPAIWVSKWRRRKHMSLTEKVHRRSAPDPAGAAPLRPALKD